MSLATILYPKDSGTWDGKTKRPLKVKCIRDEGGQCRTEGKEYPAEFNISGLLIIAEDGDDNAEWSASQVDNSGFYTVVGLDYLTHFELLSTED
ncbi:hypothetical protein FAQ20_09480 [Morganella morganii]|nr:hypothetical protein [Morganella morganii]EGT3631022.1 hypothetical protein [Morganella morganii]EGT3635502.1 hypothetical protein [Morganella morganii]